MCIGMLQIGSCTNCEELIDIPFGDINHDESAN